MLSPGIPAASFSADLRRPGVDAQHHVGADDRGQPEAGGLPQAARAARARRRSAAHQGVEREVAALRFLAERGKVVSGGSKGVRGGSGLWVLVSSCGRAY